MKKIQYLASLLLIMILMVSCNTPSTKVLLTGVYTPRLIDLDKGFTNIQTIALDGDNIYVVGSMETDGNVIQTIATIKNGDENVTYETLPVGSSIVDLAVSNDKELALSTGFDEVTFQRVNILYCIESGNVEWEKPVSEIITLPDNYWGNIYIASSNNKWYVGAGISLATMSYEGELLGTETLSSDINGLKMGTDGFLHIWGRNYHKIIDKNGSLIDAEQMKGDEVYFTNGYDYCYTNENGLYGHTLGAESDTEIMNWTNSGIAFSQGVRSLAVISPETIYIYGSDGIGGKTGLWKYIKSDDIEFDGAAIINVTYTEDGRNQIPLAAVKFNASQANYRIVLNELSSSNSDGELIGSIDKAILDGNVGDIVVTQDIDTLRKYGEKGVFTNLYSLMNDDMSSDDIFGCVRQACEINGKLYGIPREFRLETYAAKKLDDAKIWNMDAFITYASSLEDDRRALLYMTQKDVYNVLRDSVISACIDLENHTCSFDSDTFQNFLSYIVSLPKESAEEFDWNENYYMNGKVSLYASDISSYASYYQMKSVFGEEADAKIVGYPSAEGGASKFIADAFYSVTETSNVKEGALTFIHYLLSADCVIDEMRGMRSIPSLKTTAKAWDESEGKLYYFFYYDNIGRWTADNKPITADDEGAPGVCIQLTQERINEVYDFLDTVKVYPYIPSSIVAIVDEDMEAFMSTAKTAEETAKVIQNRVRTYLSEKE